MYVFLPNIFFQEYYLTSCSALLAETAQLSTSPKNPIPPAQRQIPLSHGVIPIRTTHDRLSCFSDPACPNKNRSSFRAQVLIEFWTFISLSVNISFLNVLELAKKIYILIYGNKSFFVALYIADCSTTSAPAYIP